MRAATLLAFALLVGCSPRWYRQRADQAAYRLVDGAAVATQSALPGYSINVDPRSRMYDPSCADHPAMPPDDPAAHRLMHCVDCKAGSPCWRCAAQTPFVDNPAFARFLPRDEEGKVVLDLDGAMYTALLNSRDYQQQLEELYLSALDVSAEQFRFDTQFFGGSETFFTNQGPIRSGVGAGSSVLDVSPLRPTNRLRAERLLAGGGSLVVGLANSLVWEFAGPDEHSVTTLLDFSFIQPLLRASGRAVVLESLTESERNLLANVRQLERFRRAFYVDIVAGRGAGRGPLRGGGFLGDIGLTTIGGAGGYMGLLQDTQIILNLEANVVELRDSLDQLQASYDAGRITDRFQVDLARQALYSAQSRLITAKAQYQDSLDAFKFRLGLPPNLEVDVTGQMLDQFKLLAPELTEISDTVQNLLAEIREAEDDLDPDGVTAFAKRAAELRGAAIDYLSVVQSDLDTLEANLPERRETLERLAERPEVREGDIERAVLSVAALDARVAEVQRDFPRLTTALRQPGGMPPEGAAPEPESLDALAARVNKMHDTILELRLVQALIRLDAVVMEPIELSSRHALLIAGVNRRDLMNARSALVDAWRLITVAANDLESDLDVVFSGDLGNVGDNPLKLDARNGSLRAGLVFDAPFTRLLERNAYRESLINFQRARRQYYAYVDRIDQTLRATLRTIRLNEMNFEIQRESIRVAASQADLARLRLQRPPKPEETSDFGGNTGRDLVQALGDLLNAQNDFLGVWVSYEVQRMSLDLDLGTMEIDSRGLWIDPGANIGEGYLPGDCDAVIEGLLNDEMSGDPPAEELPPLLPDAAPPQAAPGERPPVEPNPLELPAPGDVLEIRDPRRLFGPPGAPIRQRTPLGEPDELAPPPQPAPPSPPVERNARRPAGLNSVRGRRTQWDDDS
jgi:outer membrane protein TolC